MEVIRKVDDGLTIVEKANGIQVFYDAAGEIFAVIPPVFERETASAQHEMWFEGLECVSVIDNDELLEHLLEHPAPAASENCKAMVEYLVLHEIMLRRKDSSRAKRELASVVFARHLKKLARGSLKMRAV